jgi:polyphosphate kinase
VHYIGSADLMPRNLDRRVEALTPVTAPDLRAQLDEIIDIQLAEDILAWVLGADGTWHKDDQGGRVDSHRRLQELALSRRLPT